MGIVNVITASQRAAAHSHYKKHGLSNVDVDGVATPADDRGVTFATYLPGSTLQISGIPAAGLPTPLDILCCDVDLCH